MQRFVEEAIQIFKTPTYQTVFFSFKHMKHKQISLTFVLHVYFSINTRLISAGISQSLFFEAFQTVLPTGKLQKVSTFKLWNISTNNSLRMCLVSSLLFKFLLYQQLQMLILKGIANMGQPVNCWCSNIKLYT